MPSSLEGLNFFAVAPSLLSKLDGKRAHDAGSPDNQTASAFACYDIETVDLGLLSPCT